MGKCCEELAARVTKIEEDIGQLARAGGYTARAGLLIIEALKAVGIGVNTEDDATTH